MSMVKGFVWGGCLVVFLSVGAMPCPASASGIPVFDGANAINAMQQIAHMIEQINQLKSQLQVAERNLQQMSSIRGMGGIIGSEYDNNMDIDYGSILSDANIKAADDFGLKGDTAALYNDKNKAAAEWKGRSSKFMNQAVDRFTELQKLVAKVNAAPDPKDVMDLQARIQSEEALLQNEMLKLEMMQSQAQADRAVIEQKATQSHLNMGMKPGSDW